jgi:XRE family aerobic/anaerobic benzoate catabolism transcriptional regulator
LGVSIVSTLLGQRIRKLRQARGWRQLDLAEQAGLNENFISDLELGRKEACLGTLATLARAFDIKLAELFRGVE